MSDRTCVFVSEDHVGDIVLETGAFPGVTRIAKKVAKDIKLVCGVLPEVRTEDIFDESDGTSESRMKVFEDIFENNIVFAATLGNSDALDFFAEVGALDLSQLKGKREVYKIMMLGNSVVIAGSDKLGTIYGLFALSEYIGVSPMVKFGDARPCPKKEIILKSDIETVSKEPSVRYRGFFINDEWPCFGNWAMEHFGGVNSKLYDQVFEFLLRMKGNYMWPAMWASSFPLDGPEGRNEELADMYGITIGYSHHEPCLRASEEWDKVKGKDTPYGDEWNFYTNKRGLVNYWTDSLKRSGKYKNLITIGMRGERDSSMLGPESTLKDNIDLLKSIITAQRGLIMHYVNFNLDKVPQLLALYKEVEAYFYGDEETEGLKSWKDLENVIFMLCEDNYGHMRTLPTKEIRDHKGGFGMYYHLDYHGGPVSYEWMPSTPLSLIWEQMTEAYEYGVKDVWIVNVGDIKGNEVALNYFLDLAYDFEKWGSSAPNSWRDYLYDWSSRVFKGVSEEQQKALADIYVDFVKLNFMRRPEALNEEVYHPCNYGEADRILAMIEDLEKRNEETYKAADKLSQCGIYSMIYYPAKISMNLIRMQVYAGKNAHYASQGRLEANRYADLIKECIDRDAMLCKEFGEFMNGRWRGMELEKHIGFTKWNDDGWRYPVRRIVEPVTAPRMSVSRADEAALATKNYGAPQCIRIDDFMDPAKKAVKIEISNDGIGSLHYTIRAEQGEIPSWLLVSSLEGEVEALETVTLSCDRAALAAALCEDCEGQGETCSAASVQTVRLLISDGDTVVAAEVKAANPDLNKMEERSFLSADDVIVMEAHHFAEKKDVVGAGFVHLEGHGRSGNGMKVLPSTAEFTPDQDKPEITYRFEIANAGNYNVELWVSPVNSLVNKRALRAEISSGKQDKVINILDADFRGGDYNDYRWSQAVMNQIHIVGTEMEFEAGAQELTIGALEAGMVLERIVIYPKGKKLKTSYLGPMESFYKAE